jgi:hypothetical protein
VNDAYGVCTIESLSIAATRVSLKRCVCDAQQNEVDIPPPCAVLAEVPDLCSFGISVDEAAAALQVKHIIFTLCEFNA